VAGARVAALAGRAARGCAGADGSVEPTQRACGDRPDPLRQRSAALSKLDRDLSILVTEIAPHLLDECGVGAVCAAQLLISSGDPGRMASEASFAALADTTPVDASSGKQQRHRLNRGGDRRLNWALT
jgi:transposase